jgi:hypothetical protein
MLRAANASAAAGGAPDGWRPASDEQFNTLGDRLCHWKDRIGNHSAPVSSRKRCAPLFKALRLVKQNREVAMDTMMKFSELDRELAAHGTERSGGTTGTIGTYSAWSTKKRRKTISTLFAKSSKSQRKCPSSAPTISALPRKRTVS